MIRCCVSVLKFFLIPVLLFQLSSCKLVEEPEEIQPPEVQEGDIIPFQQCTEKPVLLESYDPVYPDSALQAGIEGTVVVSALVGIDGFVEETEIALSIPGLDSVSVDAARRYRFIPAKYHDILVRVWVSIVFSFKLP